MWWGPHPTALLVWLSPPTPARQLYPQLAHARAVHRPVWSSRCDVRRAHAGGALYAAAQVHYSTFIPQPTAVSPCAHCCSGRWGCMSRSPWKVPRGRSCGRSSSPSACEWSFASYASGGNILTCASFSLAGAYTVTSASCSSTLCSTASKITRTQTCSTRRRPPPRWRPITPSPHLLKKMARLSSNRYSRPHRKAYRPLRLHWPLAPRC